MTRQTQHDRRTDPDPELTAALHAALRTVPTPVSTVDMAAVRRLGARERLVRRHLPRAPLVAGAVAAGTAIAFNAWTPSAPRTQLVPPAATVTESPTKPGPYDPDARMQPELMVVSPSSAAPGARVELTFPEGTERGVGYVLEQSTPGGWQWRYALTSDLSGSPSSVPAADHTLWPLPGVSGVGPDVVEVPGTAQPGSYRICTAVSVVNICTPLQVR